MDKNVPLEVVIASGNDALAAAIYDILPGTAVVERARTRPNRPESRPVHVVITDSTITGDLWRPYARQVLLLSSEANRDQVAAALSATLKMTSRPASGPVANGDWLAALETFLRLSSEVIDAHQAGGWILVNAAAGKPMWMTGTGYRRDNPGTVAPWELPPRQVDPAVHELLAALPGQPDDAAAALRATIPEEFAASFNGESRLLRGTAAEGRVTVLAMFADGTIGHRDELHLRAGLEFVAGHVELRLRHDDDRYYRAMLDMGADEGAIGDWQWRLGQEEIVLGASSTRLLGDVPVERALRRDAWEVRIHPGDLVGWRDFIGGAALARGAVVRADFRVLGFDERWYWLSCRARQLPAESFTGAPPRIVGLFHNRTESHEAESIGGKLITAIEQTGDGVMITDTMGIIEYVNPAFCRMTGYPPEESVGRPASLLKSGQQSSAFYRELWSTITRGDTWTGRMVNRRRDGTLYSEDTTVSPVRDHLGRVTNFVAVKRDVTADLELESQLQQAQRMDSIGRVSGGLVHDFNNLLMGIMLFADLAMRTMDKDDPLYRQIVEIRKAGSQATELIRKLMAICRKQHLEFALLDLNEVARDLAAMVERLIGEQIELRLELGDRPNPIKADSEQLQQAILNLVLNARDAMPGGGTLTMRINSSFVDAEMARRQAVSTIGWYTVLEVADTGTGISPQILDRIYEPFFTTKTKEQGSGLGLATVYNVVRQHAGFIRVDTAVGRGTAFRLYLPRAPLAKHRQDDAPDSGVKAGTEHLLVVEDEPMSRQMLAEVLQSYGYRVTTAADGRRAMDLADQLDTPVDLLISDVVMPEMTGPVVFRHLQTLWPRLKVIYISGYGADQLQRSGNGLSADLLVAKPFSMVELAGHIRRLLDT